jgi:hypothetical protein
VQAALRFILQNLPDVCDTKGFETLCNRNPELMSEIYDRAKQRNELYYGAITTTLPEDDVKPEDAKFSYPFPWKHVFVMLTILALYFAVQDRTKAMSNITPALNLLSILVVVGYAMYSLKD